MAQAQLPPKTALSDDTALAGDDSVSKLIAIEVNKTRDFYSKQFEYNSGKVREKFGEDPLGDRKQPSMSQHSQQTRTVFDCS